ncbi:hypothetical protein [Ammoniphilus sp. YIM 78166]|uniref:hypothetical protein n=1 Tax=Ammoniphilus sp. YIM 78166 TaxID=1644106 RepID=UPI0014309359|nr:hypothetical protein [Ammoniphilus sp. YIM 78166]
MGSAPEKPVYYDGSGPLKIVEISNNKEFVIKPINTVCYKVIPYFPFLIEKEGK